MSIELKPDESLTILGHTGSGKTTLIESVIAPARAQSQKVIVIDTAGDIEIAGWEVTHKAQVAKRKLKDSNVIWRTPPDKEAIDDMLTWLFGKKGEPVHVIFDEVTSYHRKNETMPMPMYRIFNEGRKYHRTATVGARRYQQLHNEYMENAAHMIAFKMQPQGVRYLRTVGLDSAFCDELGNLKPFHSAHRHYLYDEGQYDILPPCACRAGRDQPLEHPEGSNSSLPLDLTGGLI